MGTWGTEVTFTAGTDKGTHTGSNNDAGEDAVTKNGVTISTTNGAFGAAQYRVYKNETFKVSSTVGNITKVVITCPVASTGNYSSKFFTGNGYSASADGTTGTWTGDATDFSLTASAQVRMTKIVVTIGESESVNPPTFTPPSGTYETTQSVTISADQGCEIYYTLDGTTDPTSSSTKYTNAISVSETTTIKAIAVNGEKKSDVVTATYTIAQAITVAQARTQATGDVFTKGIVTSCVGTTAYMQDETAGICVYGKSLTVGDQITVQGTLTTFNGLLEITNPVCNVLSSGNTVTPAVKKISEITNAIQGQLVKIEEATVTAIEGSNTTIKQNGAEIVVRGITGVTLAVDDVITLTGNVGCYNTVQIANPANVTVKANEDSAITLDSYAITVSADGDTKTLNVTYSNFTPEDKNIDLVFYATADGATIANCDWITFSIEDGAIELEIDANTGEERKAYFKVYSLDDDDNNIYSDLVTLTQEAYKAPAAEFAELPFEFNGGKADIEDTDGLTQNGLGSDYNSSSNPTTRLKFDNTDDWLLLQFDERPGTLTFDIKNNSFSGGTFKVQTSEDGETFTDLQTYTELSGTKSQEFNNLGEGVRYIKWIYTEKSNGNVGLGNIVLEKYAVPTTYTLTISKVEKATITAYDEEGDEIASGDEVMAGANVTLTVDIDDGYELKSVSVTKEDGSDVTVTENTSDGSWTFAMPSSDVTVTCTVVAAAIYTSSIYKKVTSTDGLTSGTYLIVYEEGSLAFDGSLETLDAEGNTIEVIIQDNKIEGSDVIDAATFTIDINEEGNTIQSASGYFIGQTRDANGMLSSATTEYTNTISINGDGGADIVSEGGAYLRYNAASNAERFRYYKSTTYTSQKAIQLYKLVSQEAVPVELTIGTIGYSTLYYSNKALVVPEGVVAKTFKLNDPGTDVVVSTLYEKDEVIPADCGVVIEAIDKGKEQDFTFDVAQTEATPDPDNLLLGLDEGGQTVGPDGDIEGYIFYMLSTKNGNVGFYWKHGGAPFETKAHKAYLAIPKESGVNISSFVFDDLNGITAITNNSTEGAEDVYTLSGMRMDSKQLPKGIYIVNGKKMVIK